MSAVTRTYLALGSNLGDRRALLAAAREELQKLASQPIESAALYETAPWDCPPDSPPFLNTVLQLDTELPPMDLLARTQAIEEQLGRAAPATRGRNAPRPIDIDLLVYGDRVMTSPELNLPHPRLHERLFVLYPLRDLAPTLIPPTHANPVSILLEICESIETPPVRLADSW
ncbi:MAG: 2-amino-4-hydroxy-6-hydroxymethyldihydropteridine diphosphokinase [Verrucomicrobiota bacterium JB023]|nr:2-amino-4-hydroxy-6-hydroxymethyldihydropteridine diphosphokinase [Verrucomicrobiota bacterium JB023]